MSVEFMTLVIHHIALRSTDLARSNQFYTQLGRDLHFISMVKMPYMPYLR